VGLKAKRKSHWTTPSNGYLDIANWKAKNWFKAKRRNHWTTLSNQAQGQYTSPSLDNNSISILNLKFDGTLKIDFWIVTILIT